MIKFAVINLKCAVKKILKIIIVILFIIGIINISKFVKNIDYEISFVDLVKSNINYEKTYAEISLKSIVYAQIPNVIYASDDLENEVLVANSEETETNIDDTETDDVTLDTLDLTTENADLRNLSTEVVSENNISESYNTLYGSVKIKNETSFELTEDILTPDVEYTNVSDIVIFHTHTCESYTATEENLYVASGNYRTTDLNYSVARVGTVLSDILTEKGYNVTHLLTYHDYPAYNGSYTRSYETVSSFLASVDTSPQIIIDIHRDAVGSNSSYAPSVKIGDETVAQLMFVIGTNGGGLTHDNWQTNLKFAIKIQEVANEMYPGLFRPIIVRNSRYNQNLADSSFIIEVGATGNTLEEATGSMKYLAEVLSEVVK